MHVTPLQIPAVLFIELSVHQDQRGFFMESYNKKTFEDAGISIDFVQDNHTYSSQSGTLRGLHFQTPPYAQDKLVRVLRGQILDVAVDLRSKSLTYGHWVSKELSCSRQALLVPAGFAHGFVTLQADTEVVYKVSNYFMPQHDKGVAWNDPDLKVDWNIKSGAPLLSEKDQKTPLFRDLDVFFD